MPTPSLCSQGPASNIRGAKHRLVKNFTRDCTHRENFLSNRIVSAWNELPEVVINSKTINAFKNKLDAFLKSKTNNIDSTIAELR